MWLSCRSFSAKVRCSAPLLAAVVVVELTCGENWGGRDGDGREDRWALWSIGWGWVWGWIYI